MHSNGTGSSPKLTLPRRHFIKGIAGGLAGAALAGSFVGRTAMAAPPAAAAAAPPPPTGPFKLPPLPYEYAALEPNIDTLTMKIHHDKHHQAYVNNLNIAVKNYPDLQAMSVDDLLKNLDKVPEPVRMAVRNNGGGHANHTLFWTVMGPHKGGSPHGKLADAISASFGSFAEFRKLFSDAAIKRFGSGWAWLSIDGKGKLTMESLPNQDSPISTGKMPVLGLDVWEHAYYLKYQNKRPDYVAAWWNTVNWDAVSDRYEKLAS